MNEQTDLLDLIDSDPAHAEDRAKIDEAIRTVARVHGGIVDPNLVRNRLTRNGGLQVTPQALGARYSALRRAGVLTREGWTVSTDVAGRNAGKPSRTYRLAGGL